MKHTLILDDDLQRWDTLSQYAELYGYPKMGQVLVPDVETAKIEILKVDNWDLMLLDHDLGGEVYVASTKPNTGYQLTKFMKLHKVRFDRCIIHTMNSAGAEMMLNEIRDYTTSEVFLMPFCFVHSTVQLLKDRGMIK
jgi:hypothetical protein